MSSHSVERELVQRLEAHVDERGGRGVVDQRRDRAVGVDRGGDAVAHAVLVGDVDGQEHGLAAGGADALDVLLALVDRAAAEDDLGALRGEHLRHGAADAAGGTGDQCDLAVESHDGILAVR